MYKWFSLQSKQFGTLDVENFPCNCFLEKQLTHYWVWELRNQLQHVSEGLVRLWVKFWGFSWRGGLSRMTKGTKKGLGIQSRVVTRLALINCQYRKETFAWCAFQKTYNNVDNLCHIHKLWKKERNLTWT